MVANPASEERRTIVKFARLFRADAPNAAVLIRLFVGLVFASEGIQGPAGDGLGLALAKHIVELQGGILWLEDGTDGESCVFIVDLKADSAPPTLREVE